MREDGKDGAWRRRRLGKGGRGGGEEKRMGREDGVEREFTICLSLSNASIHCFLTSAILGIDDDPLVLSLVVHSPSILYCTGPMQTAQRHT